MHTRALGNSLGEDLLSIIAGAGLLGAITDTELVVVGLAQTSQVTGLAVEIGGLVLHVGQAHGLEMVSLPPATANKHKVDLRHTPRQKGRQQRPCQRRP